mmetsp:Transcript_22674/g.74186  ORF Transcript_22674/g.74186 Transcript_22674/m.74186 type:complete len:84 (-) Transcript_22674:127-378(-)
MLESALPWWYGSLIIIAHPIFDQHISSVVIHESRESFILPPSLSSTLDSRPPATNDPRDSLWLSKHDNQTVKSVNDLSESQQP